MLLIIFVITTPMLEQGLDLSLPEGGAKDKLLEKSDIKTVDISPQGKYVFAARPITLAQLESELAKAQRKNPKLVVYIRCDQETAWKHMALLMNRLESRGIKDYSFRMTPPSK